MNFHTLILFLIIFFKYNIAEKTFSITFVILNNFNKFDITRAELLEKNTLKQYKENKLILEPHFLLNHRDFKDISGAWTFFPILSILSEKYINSSTVVFCTDNTIIDLFKLQKEFLKIDFNKDVFYGRVLQDRESTIIHHYNFKNGLNFKYPDITAGIMISMPLIKKLSRHLKIKPLKIDFTIDPYYEFTQYIYYMDANITLMNAEFMCPCYDNNFDSCAIKCFSSFPICDTNSVENKKIYFAIKTCTNFHKTRLPILKKTWGKYALNIGYYSDANDTSIPTINLGIPNAERGHCNKFMAILKHVYYTLNKSNFHWIVIADDDTLINVFRLRKLLSCYEYKEDIYLGERYGYGSNTGKGYDYITLGGGMVFSQKGLQTFIESNSCKCASNDSPDDMVFGMCLQRLGLSITHSPLFHQARPMDYATKYLENFKSISFHRHTDHDVYKVYREWLSDSKENEESLKFYSKEEL